MIPFEWYWPVFTIAAAAAQTVRNAAQRSLTGSAGISGATQVRFLYGLPFAALFFGMAAFGYGLPPAPDFSFFGWTLAGAVLQVGATALLLAAMHERNFSSAVAYSRTEPVQIAVFGLVILDDPLTLGLAAAVVAATFGVILLSWPKAGAKLDPGAIAFGVLAGTGFALSAVCFRGAIQIFGGPFPLAASATLLAAMAMQTLITGAYMLVRDRGGFRTVLRLWRVSLIAGFAGALASQFWFLAFALESAARVRTLGVVEILFAQIVSARIFREGASWRELAGLALVVAGVVLVLNA